MSLGTAPQKIETVFPEVIPAAPLPVPVARDTPINAGLAQIIGEPGKAVEARGTLKCLALIKGDTIALAQKDADSLVTALIDNSQVIMTYGESYLEGVNALSNRLLEDLDSAKLPAAARQIVRDFNDGMREAGSKYDVSNPKVREKYEKWSGRIRGFLHGGKTMLEMFIEDITSIQHQLDKAAETLNGKQGELLENLSRYDALYEENEKEVQKLIYAIAVMELAEAKLAEMAAAVSIGDTNLGDRGTEQQARLADLANMMAIRIGDYKGRLFIAWATSPQVRMMRGLDIGLAQKLNTLVTSTIPTMKQTLAMWLMLMKSMEAQKMAEITTEVFNETVQGYYKAAGVAVPAIAQTIQDPIMAAETFSVMAQSVAAEAKGLIDAMEYGDKRRQENDEAAVEAAAVMTDATKSVSDATIQRVIGAATKPLQIETSVPSVTAG